MVFESHSPLISTAHHVATPTSERLLTSITSAPRMVAEFLSSEESSRVMLYWKIPSPVVLNSRRWLSICHYVPINSRSLKLTYRSMPLATYCFAKSKIINRWLNEDSRCDRMKTITNFFCLHFCINLHIVVCWSWTRLEISRPKPRKQSPQD